MSDLKQELFDHASPQERRASDSFSTSTIESSSSSSPQTLMSPATILGGIALLSPTQNLTLESSQQLPPPISLAPTPSIPHQTAKSQNWLYRFAIGLYHVWKYGTFKHKLLSLLGLVLIGLGIAAMFFPGINVIGALFSHAGAAIIMGIGGGAPIAIGIIVITVSGINNMPPSNDIERAPSPGSPIKAFRNREEKQEALKKRSANVIQRDRDYRKYTETYSSFLPDLKDIISILDQSKCIQNLRNIRRYDFGSMNRYVSTHEIATPEIAKQILVIIGKSLEENTELFTDHRQAVSLNEFKNSCIKSLRSTFDVPDIGPALLQFEDSIVKITQDLSDQQEKNHPLSTIGHSHSE